MYGFDLIDPIAASAAEDVFVVQGIEPLEEDAGLEMSPLEISTDDLAEMDMNIVGAEEATAFADSDLVSEQLQIAHDDAFEHLLDDALSERVEFNEDSGLDKLLDTGLGCLGICNVRCITYGCIGKGTERR